MNGDLNIGGENSYLPVGNFVFTFGYYDNEQSQFHPVIRRFLFLLFIKLLN